MYFSKLSVSAALLSVAVATPVPVAANAVAVVPNSYIIQYKDGASASDITAHHAQITAKLGKAPDTIFSIPGFEGVHVKTDAIGLAKISTHPSIQKVDRDMTFSLGILTNNTNIIPSAKGGPIAQYLVQQPSATWGLGRISHFSRGFYNYIFDTSACSNTLAYVLDTGVRTTHTEFGGRASWGTNFITGSPDTDEMGHGTHVAGTIIGTSVGVCKSGKIVAVKILDKTGHGTWAGMMSGMQWSYNNAKSRNMLSRSVQSISIGGSFYGTLNNFVNSIVAAGMPVVVAAGNDGANTALYSPSSAASAITVGAMDFYNNKPAFSNFGAGVDIFAPGVSILSSYFTCDTCYYYMDGTSMAAPHVSGLALYFIAKEGISGPTAILNRLIAASVKNYVINSMGSPNRIAYNADGY